MEVKLMKIGELATCYAGATPKTSKSEYWENGTIPWMSSGEVNLGVVYETEKKITQCGYDHSSTKMVPANSIVIALAGQGKTRGTVAITKIELCTNQSLCAIVPNEQITPEYLLHYLKSRYLDLRRISDKDGNRGGLNLDMIKNYEIPVPDIDIQKKIVEIIDEYYEKHNSLLSALSQELEARTKQFEYYRERLMTASDEWTETILLNTLVQAITDGPHETPTLVEVGVPFISAEAVQNNEIHFELMRGFITEEYDEICCKKYKPQRNDIYMCKSGSTTGKLAMVETDIRFNIWSPLAAIRVNPETVIPKYMFYYLQTNFVQKQVKEKSSKGSQPNLSMRKLEQFKVYYPSLEEQERIIEHIDALNNAVVKCKHSIEKEIELREKQLSFYREKLFSFGRL